MSDLNRFDRLTKRHRECLLGVRALQGSKEIADTLGIEKSTVDSYLTEATRILGARNRRHAALLLAEHEAAQAVIVAQSGEVSVKSVEMPDPDKMGADSARLVPPPQPLPSPVSPDEQFVGQLDADQPGTTPRSSGFPLPFRRKGQADNDLSIGGRLIWIQAIAVGSAIGFGMLAMGLQVVTTVIESLARHLS